MASRSALKRRIDACALSNEVRVRPSSSPLPRVATLRFSSATSCSVPACGDVSPPPPPVASPPSTPAFVASMSSCDALRCSVLICDDNCRSRACSFESRASTADSVDAVAFVDSAFRLRIDALEDLRSSFARSRRNNGCAVASSTTASATAPLAAAAPPLLNAAMAASSSSSSSSRAGGDFAHGAKQTKE